MAETQPFQLDLDAPDSHTLPAYRRLGLLNGLLIGLALGLGAWGVEVVRAARLPLPLTIPALLLGILLLTVLGAFIGWLSARIARGWVTVLLWLAGAVVASLGIGYLPFHGRTVTAWLADPRFFGRNVYPNSLGGSNLGLVLSGLFILVVLGALALLQSYRLENMVGEMHDRRWPNRRAWLALLLPLPLVFVSALSTSNAMVNPAATAAGLTNRAILRAQAYEGDLRDLPSEGGITYMALRPVHELIDGPFTLGFVDNNVATATATVAAHFDSGNWIQCSIINDQFNFCYDARLVYMDGLRGLITGEAPPENCHTCDLTATDEAAAWLAEHNVAFGPQPIVMLEAQQGNTVLLRAAGEEGFAALCWVEGIDPPTVTSCAAD